MIPERLRTPLKRAALVVSALAALSIAGSRAATLSAAEQSLRRLPAPKNLSAEGRLELKARMARHGNTMSNLVRGVILLDRPTVRVLAGRIADEEIVAPRRDGQPTLPAELLAEQSALRTGAQQLALAAAEGSDDAILADRFAAVARTCVICHGAYLRGRP